MIIQRVEMDPFGGMAGSAIDFDPGLNIILGDNEAGKSTLFNAIFSALFLESNLRKSSADWKDFLSKYLPYPHGDTMKVTLHLACHRGQGYRLTRSWGAVPLDNLALPGGNQVNDRGKVAEHLGSLLGYGRGTYAGILMARQEEAARALQELKKNQEAQSTLGGLLRAAVLQSGGVSVEELGEMIRQEKKKLLENWDLERNSPRGGRGIHNPYKRGLGLVLTAFYQVEDLKKQVKEAGEAETRVGDLEKRLKGLTRALAEELGPQKGAMEKIEGDISRRNALEPQLELVIEKGKGMKKTSLQWPRTQEKLSGLEKERGAKQARAQALEGELKEAREVLAAREKRELHRQLRPLVEQQKKEEEMLRDLPGITPEDLKKMEGLQVKKARLEATLEAMELRGSFFTRAPLEIQVTSGMGEARTIQVDREARLDAQGRVRLETSQWSLEVQSGQGDVDKLMEEIKGAGEGLGEKLREFTLKSLEEAQGALEKKISLENSLKQTRVKMEALLKDLSYGELEKQVAGLPGDKNVREPRVIEEELRKTQLELEGIKSQAKTQEQQVKEWETKYGDLESLLDQLVELRGRHIALKKELDTLAPLPKGFASPGDFMKALKDLRVKQEEATREIADTRVALAEARNNLPGISREELLEKMAYHQKKLDKYRGEGRAVSLVEEEYARLVSETSEKTFEPLVSSLACYLAPLTGHRYGGAALEGPMPSHIKDADGKELPAEYLSAGTARGLLLALRLAVAGYLLKGRAGFLVMDDPLVDLDPHRKKEAAAALASFARDCQVLITTCDPATAALLGGRQVKI